MSIKTLARTIRPFFTLSGAIEPLTLTSDDDCGAGFEKSVTGNRRMTVNENKRRRVKCLVILSIGSD
jgi:hypothetical protein